MLNSVLTMFCFEGLANISALASQFNFNGEPSEELLSFFFALSFLLLSGDRCLLVQEPHC